MDFLQLSIACLDRPRPFEARPRLQKARALYGSTSVAFLKYYAAFSYIF